MGGLVLVDTLTRICLMFRFTAIISKFLIYFLNPEPFDFHTVP